MVFTENGTAAHGYLFIAGFVAIIMFLIYVFICEHKISINGNDIWVLAFKRNGMNDSQIKNLTHDDSMWYYKLKSTCVAYGGDFSEKCRRYESYCAGGDKYGDEDLQALAVKEALDNDGEHPMCPLVYTGAE